MRAIDGQLLANALIPPTILVFGSISWPPQTWLILDFCLSQEIFSYHHRKVSFSVRDMCGQNFALGKKMAWFGQINLYSERILIVTIRKKALYQIFSNSKY
ncbi:hypothetical protein BpHYR1_032574 [Brachionus plicatilis]|uniref:Uncharacterized protein n=1 Tax=Brachionus plicatilis TaxID=10195 RepID=A0A3M7R401_BRAPC|nr:hypothetical protein BpHYR1_032574 [Brachionus plicatilis]